MKKMLLCHLAFYLNIIYAGALLDPASLLVDGGADGMGSLLGQKGPSTTWENWYNSEKHPPFQVVQEEDKKVLIARKHADATTPSAGLNLKWANTTPLVQPLTLSVDFRFEGEPIALSRFDAQTVRLILFDKSFFVLSFTANGVLQLYDGAAGSAGHWVRNADGSAWVAKPGEWNRLVVVLDPLSKTYTAKLNDLDVTARDGGKVMKLDPQAKIGDVLLQLQSINWKIGDDWRGIALGKISLELSEQK